MENVKELIQKFGSSDSRLKTEKRGTAEIENGLVTAGRALSSLLQEDKSDGYSGLSNGNGISRDRVTDFMMLTESKWRDKDTNEVRELNPHLQSYLMELSTSMADFPTLFNHVLDQALMGMYPKQPSGMKQLFRVNNRVRDFKTQEIFKGEGLQARLPRVGRNEGYGERHMESREFSYDVAKFGDTFTLAWEDLINDHIGIFRDAPVRLTMAGLNSEEFFLTELLAVAGGWDTTFFDNTDGGLLGGAAVETTPLTIDNVEAGISQMFQYLDERGESPIMAEPAFLVVPPALKNTAQNILRSTNVLNNVVSENLPATNPLLNPGMTRLQLVVNPYLPLVSTTGTIGSTMWGLFTSPRRIPTGEIGFLRGFDRPRVLTRTSNQNGGPNMGSFEFDAFSWKVVHVFGGTTLERRAAFVSNGQ